MRYEWLFCLLLSVWLTGSSGFCEPSPAPLASGPEVGSDVASFYVRAVTGPLSGKSVCYVCRNGDRPVVMVILRQLSPETTRLLKKLDATTNRHRAEGLRCFVVLLSSASQVDFARLQTLAFDEKLDIPLAMASESLMGDTFKSLASEADVSIVLYDHRKVTEAFLFRSTELNEAACESVITAAKKLAASSSP